MLALRNGAVVLLTTLTVVTPCRVAAEVSAQPRGGGGVDTLVMTDLEITDGIDPISPVWHPFRPLPAAWLLNPSGEQRADGPPALAFHRANGAPIAVWAYNHGTSYDIAIAEWQGAGWSAIELITSTPQSEVDPRVFIRADGTLYVVWWVVGSEPRVELTSRAANTNVWTPPLRVSSLGEAARRPSVAWFGGAVWVAYERSSVQDVFNATEIAVRRQLPQGPFVLDRVAATAYEGVVEPILHVEDDRFWLDWRYATDEFAYTDLDEHEGTGTSLEEWTDTTWVGIEGVRLHIANLVTAGPPSGTAAADGD